MSANLIDVPGDASLLRIVGTHWAWRVQIGHGRYALRVVGTDLRSFIVYLVWRAFGSRYSQGRRVLTGCGRY